MALVKCLECGNEVSTKAKACPRCGAPPEPESAYASSRPSAPLPPPPPSRPSQPAPSPIQHAGSPAWDAANQREFGRWQCFQADDAKLVACVVSNMAYAKLDWTTFYSALTEAAGQVTEETYVPFALQLIDTDLSGLSLDFQPRTFEPAYNLFSASIADTLQKLGAQIPARAPRLRGMQLGPDHKSRFCEEIAVTCRREFGNDVSQVTSHHARARAGRAAMEAHGKTDVGSLARNFGLGALAAANPLIGVPMLIGSIFNDSSKGEQTQKQVSSAVDEVTATCEWADNADAGVVRAMQAVAASTEEKFLQFVGLLVRGLMESGIAPTVDWRQLCEWHLRDTRKGLREFLKDAPFMLGELAALELDPEIRALLPEE